LFEGWGNGTKFIVIEWRRATCVIEIEIKKVFSFKPNPKSMKSSENIERIALDYDLNKSYSLLDTKVDFFIEANVLLSETIKKQKKNVDDTKNLLIANSNYRNKSSSFSNNDASSSSSILSVDTTSASLSSSLNKNTSESRIHSLNEMSRSLKTENSTFLQSKKADASSISKSAVIQGVIHPINLNSNNSKLLEPVRQPLYQTTSSAKNKTNEPSDLNNDTNNNNTSRGVNNLKNSNNFKDLFNSFESSSLDPFNDMELKTINELEELKTILQNHQTSQQDAQKQTSNTIKSMEFQAQQVTRDESLSNSILNATNLKLIQTNNFLVDNFGLPKISFVDLDINSNKL
jgi:hypothetical protein